VIRFVCSVYIYQLSYYTLLLSALSSFSDSSHYGWINTSHDSYGDILVFLDGSFGAW